MAFCQQAEGGWVAAFADEAMTKKVEYSLTDAEIQALMEANGLQLIHV